MEEKEENEEIGGERSLKVWEKEKKREEKRKEKKRGICHWETDELGKKSDKYRGLWRKFFPH